MSIYEFALKYFEEKNLSTNLIKPVYFYKSKKFMMESFLL